MATASGLLTSFFERYRKMKNDNSFQELDNQDSPVAIADSETTDFNVPPEGHRIRVDPDDLTQEPQESDAAFRQRQREYATAPDPYSPTGRKKSKIYLYDWDVKTIGKNKLAPARIKGVPAAPDAIREFLILRGIPYASQYRFRAFQIPGTKIDGGDNAYPSNHVPEEVRKRRAAASL